jgi:hypothetical protein
MKIEEAGPLSGIRPALEMAAGTVGLIAATGYVSLRARVNFLGVVADGFDPETYLFEAYSFLAPAIATLVFPFLALFAGSTLLAKFGGSQRRKFWGTRLAGQPEWKAIGLCLLSTAILLRFARHPDAVPVLLRPLSALSNEASPAENLSNFDILKFLLLLGNFMLVAMLALDAKIWAFLVGRIGVQIAGLGRIGYVLLAMCAWWASIISYNIHLRAIEFRSAVIMDKQGGIKGCGFLVLTTSASYVMWVKAEDDSSKLLYIPKDGATMGLGKLFKLGAAAAALRGSDNCAQVRTASRGRAWSISRNKRMVLVVKATSDPSVGLVAPVLAGSSVPLRNPRVGVFEINQA